MTKIPNDSGFASFLHVVYKFENQLHVYDKQDLVTRMQIH